VSTPLLSLSPGDRLGRYRIVSLLGVGGMGEVYRAHDPELHRDVALKILRRSSASTEDLARFSREARAAGGLNHPNIVAVYDVGVEAGIPYVVTELLDGETLRSRLDRGPLGFLKAADYGMQIADALGAAHAKSIWHRDVKPANAFITNDGRVKLLDFGIAKLGERHLQVESNEPTDEISDRHSVVGTAGYMSPEQVLGQPADHRSDIFALGAVLYEMFTHTRAFKRDSTVQTMTAVLQEEPTDPIALKPDLSPAAAAIVRRCLEKNKEERFQSARDLAFDLKQLRDHSTSVKPLTAPPIAGRRTLVRLMGLAALAVAAVAVGWFLAPSATLPVFEPLTFRRARIGAARFISDGRGVVYSESREGNALELWRLDLAENPPARPLEYGGGTEVLATRAGEIALSVNRRFLMGERFVGTLAVAPLGGATPRELVENIEDADWDPAGAQLAVVRSTGGIGGRSWLEYPLNTRLHETQGSIRFARVSRDGRRIAFIEDPIGAGEGGHVSVLNIPDRVVTPLTGGWKSVRGLAWSPDGGEIWFTAGSSRSNRELRSVTTSGKQRIVLTAPGSLTLWDTASDGRVLLSRDDERRSLIGVTPGQTVERELSWFDDSGLADVSDDGRKLLFSDRFGIYLRDTDGALPVRLGLTDAYADDLSPDGKNILATRRTGAEILILPAGAGAHQPLPAHNIVSYSGARWFPDGRRVLFSGREAGGNLRSYVQDVIGGAPKPLTPERIWALAISPDGLRAAAISDAPSEPGISLWSVTGSAPPSRVPGSEQGDRPVAFSDDGRSLWIFRRGEVPAQVVKLDTASGERQIWKTLVPVDVAGVYSITELSITPDGRAYFYSYRRLLSQLYVVRGIE
jgi:Tol biopolymer transport system component